MATQPDGCWVPSDVVAQVLADYGVPRPHGHVVRSPAQAAEYADARGGPVALHALNPDLGGEPGEGAVRLWLPDGNAAWQAYEEISGSSKLRGHCPRSGWRLT